MNTQANTAAWQEVDITVLWCNYYQCPHCGNEWHQIDDKQAETACQSCGVSDLAPVYSEDV